MALSTTQTTFLQRVVRDEVEPIYLVQVNLHRSINTQEDDSVLQVSSRPFQSQPTDTPAFDEWIGELQRHGPLQRSVTEGLITRGESTIGGVNFGSLTIFNNDQELDTILGPYRQIGTTTSGGYSPRNQTITQYMVGGVPYVERVPIGAMVGGDARLTDTQCTIAIQGALRFLDRTMVTNVLDRATFPNIPVSSENAPAPEAWGEVFNVEPRLVDPPEQLYFLACRGQVVTEVRSNGIPLDSFQYTTISDGRGFLLKMLTGVPAGTKITVDFEGSLMLNNTSSRLVGDIAKDILDREVPAAVINTAGIAQLKAARPYEVGIFIQGPTPIREVLLRLFRGLVTFVIEDRFGEILFGALELPTGTPAQSILDDAGLLAADAFEYTNLPPVRGAEIRYKQLETTQDATSLAGLFTSDPTRYEDLIEYYKLGYMSLPFNENATDIATDPTAVLGPYHTRITNEPHARAMKEKLFELFGSTRSLVRISIDAIGYALAIHDEFRLQRSRMNLDAGKDFRVLGLTDTENAVAVELWG